MRLPRDIGEDDKAERMRHAQDQPDGMVRGRLRVGYVENRAIDMAIAHGGRRMCSVGCVGLMLTHHPFVHSAIFPNGDGMIDEANDQKRSVCLEKAVKRVCR